MENNQKLSESIEATFQPCLPVNTVIVEVQITPSQIFKDAAEIYAQEAERVMRFTTNPGYTISNIDFEQYFKTLLYLRIMRVNNVRDTVTKAYQSDQRNYLIPAFVATLINSIGRASDMDYGFTFIPKMTINAYELLTAQQMYKLSGKLRGLALEGLVCIETGIAMSPLGELSTMAALNIEGEVLSYKKDHPIYGFYASFFKHELLTSALDPSLLRIRYGAQSDYRMYLHQIV